MSYRVRSAAQKWRNYHLDTNCFQYTLLGASHILRHRGFGRMSSCCIDTGRRCCTEQPKTYSRPGQKHIRSANTNGSRCRFYMDAALLSATAESVSESSPCTGPHTGLRAGATGPDSDAQRVVR